MESSVSTPLFTLHESGVTRRTRRGTGLHRVPTERFNINSLSENQIHRGNPTTLLFGEGENSLADGWNTPNNTFHQLSRQTSYFVAREYSTIYRSFDATEHIHLPDYGNEFLEEINQNLDKYIKNPYSNSGACEYDVEYEEERVRVEKSLILYPYKAYFDCVVLRGEITITNLTDLNITFFIKPSSELFDIYRNIDFLLPKETYLIQLKTTAPFPQIAMEYFTIYTAPIYFRHNLDLSALMEFWMRVGVLGESPLAQVDTYDVRIKLSDQGDQQYSILDKIQWTSPWRQLPNSENIYFYGAFREAPLYRDRFKQFWNLKDETLEVAMLCAIRELQRAVRRKLLKARISKKYHGIIHAGLSILIGTIFVTGLSTGYIQWFWPNGMIDWCLEKMYSLTASLNSASASLSMNLETHPFSQEPIQIFTSDWFSTSVTVSKSFELTWSHCINAWDSENPRTNAFVIARCLWTKTFETIGIW